MEKEKSGSIYISSWIDKTALKPKKSEGREACGSACGKPGAETVCNHWLLTWPLALVSLCISKCRFPLNMHNLDITFRFSLFFDNFNAWSSSHDYFIHTPLGYYATLLLLLLHLVNLLSPCAHSHTSVHTHTQLLLLYHGHLLPYPLYGSPWVHKRSLCICHPMNAIPHEQQI